MRFKTQQERDTKKKGRIPKNRPITLAQMRKHPERWGEMKFLRYESELIDASGMPIAIPSNDTKKYQLELKKIRKEARLEAKKTGKDLNLVMQTMDIPEVPIIEEATVADCMIYFSNNIPWERNDQGVVESPATMEDMQYAIAVCATYRNIQAAEDGSGQFIEIADEALTWLRDTLKADSSRAFQGTIGGRLYASVQDDMVLSGERPKSVNVGPQLVENKEEVVSEAD